MISLAVMCLSLNVYFEARNQSLVGMQYVAEVTLNRVSSPEWPSDVCDVVYQPKQFSWTHDGKSDRPKNLKAWAVATSVVRDIMMNGCAVCTDATYYHHYKVHPYWAASFTNLGRVEDHIFYK
jgi:spore germination cell wall hydrolase CwlJ-like protein